MSQHHIDIRFQTRVTRTPRVIDTAEAFGIGLSDGEFVVYEHLDLEVSPGDRVYITGESGSGKSLLLRELARQLAEAGLKVANLDAIVLEDLPLVDQVGIDMASATQLLNQAGLGEPFLYIRKPSELSDGQRYRARLAKVIETDADVWVADEFGAVLDRVTAKAVAFNIARAAKARGKTLIVATTHTDLKDEIGPMITVTKTFANKLRVELDR